ncbi:cytochrome P450 family protein [Aspergillus niger]|uniref:uncharacterized protein n=1 Tax=Aspergillus lacticoffeatus (strain CBS 101883) TaxID=1450533 RepID=UPI000D7F8354|nr:uncharacterized protein BO96DRAFT_501047 [Aspergillus niger CBS 101883]PYH55949.1 hypothetical protein BO96DRAFT_501047 [Aspergillus niger CBS 101883]GJP98372.1 cytochrome P450 family protein [Aspergillus niger]
MDSTKYVFGRNYRASVRLNYQHALIASLTDHRSFHPSILRNITSSTSFRVADLASGTALWSSEVAREYPQFQVDSFDISCDQYPSPSWRPENLILHERDILQPFPEEYHGVYDIVNVRFFITLLNEKNLSLFLTNINAILKPGGFLQWLDLDPRSANAVAYLEGQKSNITTTATDHPYPQTRAVANLMRKTPPDVESWLTDNPHEILQPFRFEQVACDKLSLPDIYRPLWNQCLLLGLEEYCSKVEEDAGMDAGASHAMRDTLNGLSREFGAGTSIDVHWFYQISRKIES